VRDGLWGVIWKNRLTKNVACLVFVVVLSSLLYLFVDWYWYYNSRGIERARDAETYLHGVESILALGTDAETSLLEARLEHLLAPSPARIDLSCTAGGEPWLALVTGREVNPNRTLVRVSRSLSGNGYACWFDYRYSNRPGMLIALWRAWSFSLFDLLENPQAWRDYRLYHRTTPLASAVLIIALISVPLFNRVFRDWQDHQQLRRRLEKLKGHKDQTLGRLNAEKVTIEQRLAANEQERSELLQRVEALKSDHKLDSDQYCEAIETLERQNHELSDEAAGMHQSIAEIQAEHDALKGNYARIEAWFASTGKTSLLEKILEMNSLEAQLDLADVSTLAEREQFSRGSRIFKKLRRQLRQLVDSAMETQVNFAQHGTTSIVQKAFEKIDGDFLSHYIVHARNERYSSHERKSIKIVTAEEGSKYSGELNLYLDHDTGCSLCLAYNTRRQANPRHVGFVLALMLRATSPAFEGYRIK